MAPGTQTGSDTESATFGALLRYLRVRARLTQRELGRAVGYSEAQISRLEGQHRAPDPTAVAALFLPALRLDRDPDTGRRLVALARTAHQTRDTAGDLAELPPLPVNTVARDSRLDALNRLLDTERRVVLCGLPGVGKTTLATLVARRRATTQPVCWLTLTAGVTDSVAALLRRMAAVLVRHGRNAAGPLVRGEAETPIALDERLRLLGEAMADVRLLLCLDNGQLLADNEPLLRVLTHLTATTMIELLVPSRVDIELAGATAHQLGGLTTAEGRALIDLFGGLPDNVVDPLLARTGGSPMLLRLALGQIRDDPVGLLRQLDARPEVGRYLLDTTVGELSESGLRLLQLIAVFRTPVDPLAPGLIELCERFGGPSDVLGAAAELRHRQLLAAPPPHPLIHDRVLAGLAAEPVLAQRLHAIAAAWCDGVDDVVEAVWHHVRAGAFVAAAGLLVARTADLIDRGQAAVAVALADDVLGEVGPDWSLLLAKGDLLAQTEDAADAEACYRLAMRHAPTTAGRGQVAGRLAEHYALRGRPAEALELCGQAKALGVGGLLAARLGAVECRALVSLADYQETLRAGRTALALLDTVPGARAREVAEITVRVYNATGQARRRLGDRVRAVEDLGQAVDTARAAGLRTLTGRALFGLAGVHVDMGKLDRGEACYAEALDVIRSVGDFHCLARTLHAQGVLRHYRGDPVGARALHEESLAVKRRIGDLGSLAISRIGLAQALLACGEVARAEELLTGPETIDDPWLRTHAVDTLAMIRMVADGGLSDPVRATLDEAGALAKSVGADPQLMAMIAVHTAVAEIAAGHADEAALLLAATPLADDYDVLPMEAEFVRGAIELVRGNRSGVRAAADRITDLVADGRPRMYLPAAQRLRAATHDAPPTSTLPRMLWVLTST